MSMMTQDEMESSFSEHDLLLETTHTARCPYSDVDLDDPSETLIRLGADFSAYLDTMTATDQLTVVSDVPIPIELTPHYVSLIMHYTNTPWLFTHGPDLRGIAANGFTEEEKPFVPKQFISHREAPCYGERRHCIIFEWRLCNRMMDPVPLGAFGAIRLFDVRPITPALVKTLIRWNMEADSTSYVISNPTDMSSMAAIKLYHEHDNMYPKFMQSMFKVLTDQSEDRSFSDDAQIHMRAQDAIETGMSKTLVKIVATGATARISKKTVNIVRQVFDDLVCRLPYFKLLPGKQEEQAHVGW